jgi:hypothetical protein
LPERVPHFHLEGGRFGVLEVGPKAVEHAFERGLSVATTPERSHGSIQYEEPGLLRIEEHQLALQRRFFDLRVSSIHLKIHLNPMHTRG